MNKKAVIFIVMLCMHMLFVCSKKSVENKYGLIFIPKCGQST